jgi:hypothetical protein
MPLPVWICEACAKLHHDASEPAACVECDGGSFVCLEPADTVPETLAG